MNAIDRCTCCQEILKNIGDGFAKFQITETDDACHVHGGVDTILASGEYFDRSGELWHLCDCPVDGCGNWHTHHPSRGITPAQMRLLIEREHHRDECPGLWTCEDHPVPAVTLSRMFRPRVYVNGEPYAWFSEAIDSARALAVGE